MLGSSELARSLDLDGARWRQPKQTLLPIVSIVRATPFLSDSPGSIPQLVLHSLPVTRAAPLGYLSSSFAIVPILLAIAMYGQWPGYDGLVLEVGSAASV